MPALLFFSLYVRALCCALEDFLDFLAGDPLVGKDTEHDQEEDERRDDRQDEDVVDAVDDDVEDDAQRFGGDRSEQGQDDDDQSGYSKNLFPV